ncbi:hypothetical protein Z043_122683 [Scleropages formosus]|uniref:SH2 domain-containing protein n=1 Tax=Scleropages formosus TaxID=113540 RepID=A0A0P7TNY1_SCLFO|nr:hypothetical protein Z043_122683 [Scleropages formosus]
MAKWFKEHLGFKTSKAPPPAPPKPDYRHCHPAVPGAPGFQAPGSSAGAPALYPSPAQPDILAAYKLQKELDFEDPYTGAGNAAFCGGLGSAGGAGGSSSSELKYVSPKHRLIKVETVEKSSPALAPAPAPAPSPGPSPPAPAAAEQDAKQEKVGMRVPAGRRSTGALASRAHRSTQRAK